MRALYGQHERSSASPRDFVLNGFSDKATPVALELIHFPQKVGGQSNCDAALQFPFLGEGRRRQCDQAPTILIKVRGSTGFTRCRSKPAAALRCLSSGLAQPLTAIICTDCPDEDARIRRQVS